LSCVTAFLNKIFSDVQAASEVYKETVYVSATHFKYDSARKVTKNFNAFPEKPVPSI
jgi:hypothetical protein